MTSQALFYCNKDGRSDVGNLKNYFVTPPLQNPGSAPATVWLLGYVRTGHTRGANAVQGPAMAQGMHIRPWSTVS